MGWFISNSVRTTKKLMGVFLRRLFAVLKRSMWKDKFEMIYVGPNQILLKSLQDNKETTVLSEYGREIEDVKIMGKDNYLVARTESTLLLVDLQRNLTSEVFTYFTNEQKYNVIFCWFF